MLKTKNKYLNILLLLLSIILLSACAGNSGGGNKKYTAKELLNEQADILIEYGENLLSIGEYTKALAELLKAEEFVSDNSHLKTLIGSAYYGRKEFDNALKSYSEALVLDPKNTEVYYYTGLVYMAQGDFEKAKSELKICLEDLKFKRQFLPLTSLGLISLRENNDAEALEYFRKAIEAEPAYPESYYFIGTYYLAKGSYHEALGYFGGAIKQNNLHIGAYMGMGKAYESLERMHEAASAYGFVASTLPHTPLGIEAQAHARRVLGYD